MTAPRRIQRRRVKGWRMPPGAIYCGRPGILGNPFPRDDDGAVWRAVTLGLLGDERGRRQAAVWLHRAWLVPGWIPPRDPKPSQIELEGRVFAAAIADTLYPLRIDRAALATRRSRVLAMLAELAGHDLVCWCRLDQPCHVDTYLELANG